MSLTMTIEVPVSFPPSGRGSPKELRSGAESASLPAGRVPRVARLMALALRLDELVRTGQVASYSALASLGHVTRARICQIVTLIHLAPDIQEALLFLPLTVRGRDPILLADLQARLAQLEQRLARLRGQREALQQERLDQAAVTEALAGLVPAWQTMTPEGQARVVRLVVSRVDYDGQHGKASITFQPLGLKTLAAERVTRPNQEQRA